MTKKRVTGLVALVLGCVIAVMTAQLPASMIIGDVGPSVFPFFSAAVLIICGAGMLIKPGDQEDDRRFDKTAWLRLALIFGIVMVYCIAMVYLGFFVPTLVLLFILSTMFSADAPVPWWQRLLFAVLLTVLIYLLFSKVLNLKLPDMQFL